MSAIAFALLEGDVPDRPTKRPFQTHHSDVRFDEIGSGDSMTGIRRRKAVIARWSQNFIGTTGPAAFFT